MPTHPATLPIDLLLRDCAFKRTRASGPGGQHRNKVETAVVVTHTPTGIKGQASERRSQADNRSVAVFRLRLALAVEVRSEAEKLPSSLWQSRAHGGRMKVNDQHDDYPALLAELLDQLAACDGQFSHVAERLQVTQSQLVKLLKANTPAWVAVNADRTARGLKPLRS